MEKTQTRHGELRSKILDCAEAAIAEGGAGAISARSLAKEAGCAVGAIYNVFPDLYAITQGVNLRTFERMRRFVLEHIQMKKIDDPKENLLDASCAYLHFALENKHLWLSIYEIEMKPVADFPKVYVDKTAELFSIIEALVEKIFVLDDFKQIQCITRTIFSGVHGIVYLGVEQRLLSVEQDDLEGMVEWLIRSILSSTK